jgi:predicted CopG family antitoxin
MSKTHKLTTISVSQENYLALKKLGTTGDSFNDVLTEILKKTLRPQIRSERSTTNESAECLSSQPNQE